MTSEYLLVLTEDELHDCVAHYLAQDAWAFDVETVGTFRGDPMRNHVLWIALSSGDRTDVIPVGHPNGDLLEIQYPLLKSGLDRQAEGKTLRKSDYSVDIRRATMIWSDPPEQLDRKAVFQALEPLFAGPAVKVGHNVKFDINSVSKYLPAPPAGPFFDTMVAEWCLNSSNFGKLSLDACAARTLGVTVEKGVGKKIEDHPFDTVADYAAIDARVTYLLSARLSDLLEEKDAGPIFDLEMQVLEVLADMERTGISVDQRLLKELDKEFAAKVEESRLLAWAAAGETFNLASVPTKQRLLYTPKRDGGQGLRGSVLTPAGEKKAREGEPLSLADYSTSAKALKIYQDKSELAQALLDHAKFGKLRTTYTRPYLGGETTRQRGNKEVAEWVESRVVNGRIHTRYTQSRVETGRLSCVSGDSVLVTTRGSFRFDEYLPQVGDRVLTHSGRWMPVVRKIFKGIEPMYSVCSAGGAKVTCTAEHRLLTTQGWVRVGDLFVGDEVLRVSEQEVCRGSGEPTEGRGGLQGPRQADDPRPGSEVGHHLPQRHAHPSGGTSGRGVRSRKGAALLTVEDGREEPYVGQEWFAAPQPHRGHRGRARIHDAEGGRSIRAGSSTGHGRGAGTADLAEEVARPSHRRGQEEQLVGQPGTGDASRTSDFAQNDRVESISPVGAMGVWDIEVAGDHSYWCGGFLNHNSKEPNLQNVPSRSEEGKKIRDLFIATNGYTLVQADYSQIEPRIIADLSGDPTMQATYLDGGDIYLTVADKLGVDRNTGKTLVLAIAYGIGPSAIAESNNMTKAEAQELMSFFRKQFPRIDRHKRIVLAATRKHNPPYSETVLGRRRYLPGIKSRDEGVVAYSERQAYNHVIQGSAADVMKLALIRIRKTLPDYGRMLLTVHDEIVTEVPHEYVEDTVEIVRQAMESVGERWFKVPLVADVKVANRWGQCKD